MTRIPHNELFSSAPSPPEVELKVDDGPNMKFTLLPMDEKAQSSPQARGWLTQYTARLPELHRRHQRKAAIAVQAAESQFTGAEVCQGLSSRCLHVLAVNTPCSSMADPRTQRKNLRCRMCFMPRDGMESTRRRDHLQPCSSSKCTVRGVPRPGKAPC